MVSGGAPARRLGWLKMCADRVCSGVYLLRVRLARGEGALAKVATLLGNVGVNISRLQTVVTDEGGAVVNFLLDVADDFLPGMILEELGWLDGVTAEGISTYPAGGGLHYDLQVVERMSRGSVPPAQMLSTAAPLLCGARWALLVDRRNFRVLFRTAAAPELRRAELTRLASFTGTPTFQTRGGGQQWRGQGGGGDDPAATGQRLVDWPAGGVAVHAVGAGPAELPGGRGLRDLFLRTPSGGSRSRAGCSDRYRPRVG
jgi:hypothetical protein